MHLHILGICGTFMGSLALLARELGHEVSGSDQNVYPPMSTQLEEHGIALHSGYDADFLKAAPDMVIVGNAMSRGNDAIEALLESSVPYCSGPEWLREHVLRGRWVLAVAGTHGKTTTTSMLTKVLDYAGLNPGFLIGGVTQDFGVSARLGGGKFFVIEADEYDSAFFDKRSKFVHYMPRTLILNNLEFDHADIFDDLAAIQRQFHHVVRTVPSSGRVIYPASCSALDEVIAKGCWSELEQVALNQPAAKVRWSGAYQDAAGFDLRVQDHTPSESTGTAATLSWSHIGDHNAENALASIAAASHVGVPLATAVDALAAFKGVKRRMEVIYQRGEVTVFDDFAHHPTAIDLTLEGLRRSKPTQRIIAVIEPRSNTMRMGRHKNALRECTKAADQVIWYHAPELDWNPEFLSENTTQDVKVARSIESIVSLLVKGLASDDQIVLMSNGGFGGIHAMLIEALSAP